MALIVFRRPLDYEGRAATIAQVVIPIFSQKFPACSAVLLMTRPVAYSVIWTHVRTLLLSFFPFTTSTSQMDYILATSKTLFFSF